MLQLVEVVLFTVCQQLDDGHLVLEMVEDDIVLIKNVEEVGRIVLSLRLVLHVDVLEITHGIEGGVAKDAAISLVRALDVEVAEEIVDELGGIVGVGNGSALFLSVGEAHHTHTMLHRHAADGVQTDEGTAVLAVVIVGTFHQGALRIGIAHTEIDAHRGVEIAQDLLGGGMIVVHVFVVAMGL